MTEPATEPARIGRPPIPLPTYSEVVRACKRIRQGCGWKRAYPKYTVPTLHRWRKAGEEEAEKIAAQYKDDPEGEAEYYAIPDKGRRSTRVTLAQFYMLTKQARDEHDGELEILNSKAAKGKAPDVNTTALHWRLSRTVGDYRNRKEIGGIPSDKGGSPIQTQARPVDLSELTDAELAQLERLAQKLLPKDGE